MPYKILIVTLLCGMAVAIAEVDVDAILAQHKQSLQALLNTPNQRHGQQGQAECFNWYFDQLDRNMDIYRNKTKQCETDFENDIKWHNVDGNKTRQDFEYRRHSVCNNFYWCEGYSDLLDFYHCYSEVSTNSIAIIYILSVDSTAEYNSLLIKYNNVSSNKKWCDKYAREDYMQRSEVTDKQFDDCRAGNWIPTTSTTPVYTDYETTDAPIEDTTFEETTEQPTFEPEEQTPPPNEAPEIEEPSPEEGLDIF